MRSLKRFLMIGLITVAADSSAAPLGFTLVEEAEMEIRTAIERARGHILRGRESFETDSKQFYAVVDDQLVPHFDMTYIARIVLGRHWDAASEQQRARFEETFKNHLVRSYSATLLQYDESTRLNWRSLHIEGQDPIVTMEVTPKDAAPVKVDFLVHKVGDEWRIYDVIAAEISMATNFRGQFNSVIRKQGIDALITRLEKHSSH